jgi:hypothetical protein
MSKILILALVLAIVLVSGPFIGARADKIGPMCWAGFCPSQSNDLDQPKRDMDQPKSDWDRPDATPPTPYRQSPVTPEPMGSPGI